MHNFLGNEAGSFARSVKAFAFFAVTCSACVRADVATGVETPAILGYGKIHAVNEKKSPYQVSPHAVSKIVFKIAQTAPNPAAVHPELDKVARAINLMVANGVPTDHMNVVVIVGGAAADVALNDARYRKIFSIANPNMDLLNKLHEAGVSIVVSDQALAAKNLDAGALLPVASTALSSFTAITSLLQAGYNVASL